MKTGTGRCIFCGKGPTTGEDIFPKWLRKSIGYDHELKGPLLRAEGTTSTDAEWARVEILQHPSHQEIHRVR